MKKSFFAYILFILILSFCTTSCAPIKKPKSLTLGQTYTEANFYKITLISCSGTTLENGNVEAELKFKLYFYTQTNISHNLIFITFDGYTNYYCDIEKTINKNRLNIFNNESEINTEFEYVINFQLPFEPHFNTISDNSIVDISFHCQMLNANFILNTQNILNRN